MSEYSREVEVLLHISGISTEDLEHVRHLKEHLFPRIPAITDRFYEKLLSNEKTRPYLDGRVEQLKQTHIAWLKDVIDPIEGGHGTPFFDRQRRIGEVHVAAGVPPLFVASSMSFLRGALSEEIDKIDQESEETVGVCTSTVIRLLDLCQYLIDSAYRNERINRLTKATGMSQKLLENIIGLEPKMA